MERRTGTQRKYLVSAAVVLLCSFCSCRFKSPTQSEGQAFAEAGGFPNGLPAWVQPLEGSDPARLGKAGIISRSYGPSIQVERSRAQAPQARASYREELEEERRQVAAVRERRAELESSDSSGVDNKADESPLDRIERSCPGLESAVSEALRIENTNARILEYSKLTRRCPSSSDLWFWLGKDYDSAGRHQEAARAFERVLALDKDNDVAKALLKVVQEKASEAAQ